MSPAAALPEGQAYVIGCQYTGRVARRSDAELRNW